MSQSRSNHSKQKSKLSDQIKNLYQRFSESSLFKPIVQTAITIPSVVATTYPLDLMANLKRSGHAHAYNMSFVLTYMIANRWNLWIGVPAACKQSGIKNSLISLKDDVHGTIKQKTATDEDVNAHGEIELPTMKRIGVGAVTINIIAVADVLATNYWSNVRLAAQLNHLPQSLHHFSDKIRLMQVAMTARYMTILATASGIIGGNMMLKPPLERVFPNEKYGYWNSFVSGVIPGVIVGPFSNFWDVIRVNQMKLMDPVTMQFPSIRQVAKNLYQTNGYSVFMRGSVMNAVQSAVMFSTIALVDQWVNYSLFAQKTKQPSIEIEQKHVDEVAPPLNSTVASKRV
jgi:hypothetical protein